MSSNQSFHRTFKSFFAISGFRRFTEVHSTDVENSLAVATPGVAASKQNSCNVEILNELGMRKKPGSIYFQYRQETSTEGIQILFFELFSIQFIMSAGERISLVRIRFLQRPKLPSTTFFVCPHTKNRRETFLTRFVAESKAKYQRTYRFLF